MYFDKQTGASNVMCWSNPYAKSAFFDAGLDLEHLTLSRPSAILFGRTKLGKTSFQIVGSDLIQRITEDRLRQASGPVKLQASVTYIKNICKVCAIFHFGEVIIEGTSVQQNLFVSLQTERVR